MAKLPIWPPTSMAPCPEESMVSSLVTLNRPVTSPCPLLVMVRLSLDAKPGRTLTSPCPDATIDESDVELGAETITAMGVTDSPLGSPVAVMDSTPFVVCTVRYLARSWFPTKLYEASPEPTCTPILKGVQFWIDVKASSVPSARA